jgi:hypothetical protein
MMICITRQPRRTPPGCRHDKTAWPLASARSSAPVLLGHIPGVSQPRRQEAASSDQKNVEGPKQRPAAQACSDDGRDERSGPGEGSAKPGLLVGLRLAPHCPAGRASPQPRPCHARIIPATENPMSGLTGLGLAGPLMPQGTSAAGRVCALRPVLRSAGVRRPRAGREEGGGGGRRAPVRCGPRTGCAGSAGWSGWHRRARQTRRPRASR